jgi:uncharacterized protein (DUF983 family)
MSSFISKAFSSTAERLSLPGEDARLGAPAETSWEAIRRGFCGRCPNCGRGHMFGRFLKVADRCEACGEELHHQRADDFPPYVVIAVVGHIVVGLALSIEMDFTPPTWVLFAICLPLTVGLAVGLLQPVKGAIIALQWFLGMHGFDRAFARRHALLPTEAEAAITTKHW